jgi:transposase
MISQWKKTAQDNMASVFTKGADKTKSDHEAEVKQLHEKIGQLTVERDFLSKAFGR